MNTSQPGLRLQQLINAGPVGRRRRTIVFVVLLVMVADGMDITIVSHLFPPIVREWGTPIGMITFVVAGGVVGMAAGALLAGRLADLWGRKNVTIAATILLGVTTAAMATAPNVETLAAFRIVSCLGLGGVMPVALTLVADLVPAGRRAQFVTVAFAGVPLGTILGAYLSAWIIPTAGWRALVVVAGLIPLAIVALFAALVPESPVFLSSRGRPEPTVRRALRRLVPGADTSAVDLSVDGTSGTGGAGGAFTLIVSRRFMVTTVLLWIFAFIGQGVQLLVVQYLPILLQAPVPGLDTVQSGLVVAMWGWGSFIGVLGLSAVLKRFDRFTTVALLLGWSLLGLVIIGALPSLGFAALLTVIFAIGLTLPAGVGVTNTLSTLAYPASARGTGVGAANFTGRLGTLVSGVMGGGLIAAGLGLSGVFLTLAAPVVVAIGVVLGLRADARRHGTSLPGHATGREATEPALS